jgi:stage V sporulation protein T
LNQTGIVRRIDDLGRVAIPKELRRVLKVGEGDPIEFFVGSDGDLIIRKYEPELDYKSMWDKLNKILFVDGDYNKVLCIMDEVEAEQKNSI